MSRLGMRGVSTVGTVLLGAGLALFAASFLTRWLIVDVRPEGTRGPHLILPVPMMALHLAARAIPEHEAGARMPAEVRRHRTEVLEALRRLDRAEDATLLQVSSPETQVLIRKVGNRLELAVDDDETHVRGSLPLDKARDILERWDWQEMHPGMAMNLLAAAGRGELLRLEAPDTQVSIRIW